MNEVLEKLGIKRIVNASGTLTVLGGNRLVPEALKAMEEVSGKFVDMEELSRRAGEYVAKLIGVPGALITSGAYAGLVLSLSALYCNGDKGRMASLPLTGGCNANVVIQRQHTVGNPYWHALEVPGFTVRIAGKEDGTTDQDVREKIDKDTVAIVHFLFEPQPGEVNLDRVAEIAKETGVPLVVDAAADLPPLSNLSGVLKRGADMVIISGGKELGGPGNSGLILACSTRLLRNCELLGPFSYLDVAGQRRTFLGRGFKVSKETIVAVAAAVDSIIGRNEDAVMLEKEKLARIILDELKGFDPELDISIPSRREWERIRPAVYPILELKKSGMEPSDLANRLACGDPSVRVLASEKCIRINTQCLSSEDAAIVISSLKKALGTDTGN